MMVALSNRERGRKEEKEEKEQAAGGTSGARLGAPPAEKDRVEPGKRNRPVRTTGEGRRRQIKEGEGRSEAITRITEAEWEEAKTKLLETIKPGDTIWTILQHVSRSKMYRVIDMVIIRDNEPWHIAYNAAKLLEGYDTKHEGAKATGVGMDMGFHLVYELAYHLFGDGYGLKQRWL